MTTAALHTEGTALKIGNAASPEVFTSIGEIVDMQGPTGSASVLDATSLSSVAKEKLMGLPDEGQVTFTINMIPTNTQVQLLRTNRAARTLTNFQIDYPDSPVTTDSFSAYILNFQVNAQTDALLRASVTLEITGAVTVGS